MTLPEEIKNAYEELAKQPKKFGIRYLLETGDIRRASLAYSKVETFKSNKLKNDRPES